MSRSHQEERDAEQREEPFGFRPDEQASYGKDEHEQLPR